MMKSGINPEDRKNLILAGVLSAILIIGWQYFVEIPKRQQLAQAQIAAEIHKKRQTLKEQQAAAKAEAESARAAEPERPAAPAPRVTVNTPSLQGSISLKGLRFDDLTLAKYRTELDPLSPAVKLLTPSGQRPKGQDTAAQTPSPAGDGADPKAPAGAGLPYFMETGWASADGRTRTPGADAEWKADRTELKPGAPVTLTWDNGQGVRFKTVLSVDENYMFSFERSVENASSQEIRVAPYALINRGYEDTGQHIYILHEGPLGVVESGLTELQYEKIRDSGKQAYPQAKGWLGFTDKYWLTALIPDRAFAGNFSYYRSKDADRYQADAMGEAIAVAPGQQASQGLRFFAGAKEITVLDRYTEGKAGAPVPLFDRAVDLGTLYFLTKPIFLALNSFYVLLGNFGLAIMLLTVIIKLVMFPLANKAYKASTQMRDLQPQMMALKERYPDDKLKFQQEVMKLYKKEKINPASGCLPILIQMPIFFALYKVLFVTIEMRHAPFYGWIRDLSAMDSSNLFTLFGLIPWTPPGGVQLGILPILMCITMVIQMAQQPKPADPTQAKIMKYLPYIFLVFFVTMPAGLLIYWIWSNILGIIQQWVITRKLHAHPKAKGKAANAAA